MDAFERIRVQPARVLNECNVVIDFDAATGRTPGRGAGSDRGQRQAERARRGEPLAALGVGPHQGGET